MDSMAESKAPSPREPLLERSPAAARAGGPASVTSRRRRIAGGKGATGTRGQRLRWAAEGRKRAGGRAAPAGRGGAGRVRGHSPGMCAAPSVSPEEFQGAARPRGWVRGWWCGRTAVPGSGAETRRGKRGSSGRGELPSARPPARRALPAPERPGVSRGKDDLGVYVFKCPQDHERPPRAAPPLVFISSTLTLDTKVFVLIVHGGD